MISIVHNRSFYAWIVLVLMTTLSWWLSQDGSTSTDMDFRWTTTAMFLLAFYKCRLVIMNFMEIRDAPLPLRGVCEAWLLVVCGAMLGIYWLA